MAAHAEEISGRLDFMDLKDHYIGVGLHAVNGVQADKVLNNFFIKAKRNHTFDGTNLRGS